MIAFSDIVIQRKIKRDDIREFEKLFKDLYSPLCNYANSYLKDMDTAEEVVQDFFYNFWKNRESLNIQISLKSYIYRSIRNNSLKYIEHQVVVKRYEKTVKEELSTDSIYSSTDELELQELNVVIENTLNELPERCRQIFSMNRFEGLKYQEIADKLSISIKTVEANMGKALQLFRKNLKQYDKLAFK